MPQSLPLPLRITRFGFAFIFLGLIFICVMGFGSIIGGNINLDAYGLTLDRENNVYIANSSSHSIVKFNSQGEKLATIGRSGDGDGQFGRFDSPRDVALSPQGTIYAIDYDKSRIEKFDRGGHFLTMWNLPNDGARRYVDALKIAVNSREQIYVAVADKGVLKFDSSGNFLGTVGADLPSKNKPANPWDLTFDANDNLYVGQPLSVFKFDSSDKFITSWEIKTFDFPDSTNMLQNIEVDHLGNIYVNNNNIVEKFDANGKFLLSWTVNIDGKFIYNIRGIGIDSENRVYLLNNFQQQVEIFDGEGHPLNQWAIAWPKWLQAGQPFYYFLFYPIILSNVILGFTENRLRKRYGLPHRTINFKTYKEYLIASTPIGRFSQILTFVGSCLGVILGYLNFTAIYTVSGTLQLPNLFSLLGLSIGQANLLTLAVFLSSILAFTALLVAKKPVLAGILQIMGVLLLLAFSPIDPLKLVLNVFPLLLGAVLALRTSLEITHQYRPGSPG